jgi:peptidoglycan/LPS O-acetylase OafA/YrhL
MVQGMSIGRAVVRILIAALCVAAVVASIALLRGEFSDTDWKVIATSTLFAVASSMAAAGVAVRDRSEALGAVAVGAVVLAFVLVTIGLWGELEGETFWRFTACVSIVALEASHIAFVLSRLRRSDPASVAAVSRAAVALAAVSGVMGIAPLAGLLPDDGDFTAYGSILGVVLVGQLLCTALAPLLRRLRAGDERPVVEVPAPQQTLAGELFAVAERLERLGAGPQVSAECERLRRLARTAASR